MEGRHASRANSVEQGVADGGVALRRPISVRRDQPVQARRPASAHLSDTRRRQEPGRKSSREFRRMKSSIRCGKILMRQGLLFAGTERAAYFSLDDGDHWQPLRLNMPATSIRDLVIHDDDIVVGTHGRSFWILDDMTPLRQLECPRPTSRGTYLFKPKPTYRFRRNKNTDTPLPPEEPAGQNPPDGAIINYYLKADATRPSGSRDLRQ